MPEKNAYQYFVDIDILTKSVDILSKMTRKGSEYLGAREDNEDEQAES